MKTGMKTIILVVCTFLCLSSISLAKERKSAANGEDQIKALMEQSRQAALKGDASYLEQNTSDDYVRVGPDGKVRSKSEMIAGLKNGDNKYQSIETSDINVRLHGDAAVATLAAEVKGTNMGQEISGRYQTMRVFVKHGGKWQEVAFTSTKVVQ
jgi:ketosteroid isomerase-like protein